MRKFRNSLIISVNCGKTGIRTLGTRKGTTVFETVPIDHSGIFPLVVDTHSDIIPCVARIALQEGVSPFAIAKLEIFSEFTKFFRNFS